MAFTKTQHRALRLVQQRLSPGPVTAAPQVRQALADPNLKVYLDSWVRPLVDALVNGAASRDLEQIL